jgi:hypothetical protein
MAMTSTPAYAALEIINKVWLKPTDKHEDDTSTIAWTICEASSSINANALWLAKSENLSTTTKLSLIHACMMELCRRWSNKGVPNSILVEAKERIKKEDLAKDDTLAALLHALRVIIGDEHVSCIGSARPVTQKLPVPTTETLDQPFLRLELRIRIKF